MSLASGTGWGKDPYEKKDEIKACVTAVIFYILLMGVIFGLLYIGKILES